VPRVENRYVVRSNESVEFSEDVGGAMGIVAIE